MEQSRPAFLAALPALGRSRRVHSGQPQAYPVLAFRPSSVGLRSRAIIDERGIFVANTIEAIAEMLSHHELIRSLGCESIVNLPAVFADEVIRTVNLRDVAGCYVPDRVARDAGP
jgi:hypothetical protein